MANPDFFKDLTSEATARSIRCGLQHLAELKPDMAPCCRAAATFLASALRMEGDAMSAAILEATAEPWPQPGRE